MEGKFYSKHINPMSKKDKDTPVDFEDALNLTGLGKYNYSLMLVCLIINLAVSMDIFGNSFVVPAAACDLKIGIKQSGILSAIPFLGIILSAHLWGYISDTRGRKLTLAWSMTGSAILSFLSSFSPNWIVMAIFKFFSTCFSSASHANTYSLLGECCPERVRSTLLLMLGSALSFSEGFAGMIAYPVLPLTFSYDIPFLGIQYKSWRLLVQLMSAVSALGGLLLYFFHESPKFMAVQNREDEALETLQKIYATNTGNLPENYPVKSLMTEEAKCIKGSSILRSLWQQTAPLFQRPLLINTIKLFYITSVVYFASNSLSMWLPFVVNEAIAELKEGKGQNMNLCGLLDSKIIVHHVNNTVTGDESMCKDSMTGTTIIAVIAAGASYMVLNILIAFIPNKKMLAISILLICGVSAMCTVAVHVPLVAIFAFLVFQTIALVMAILSTYFVELYPTTLRGMISCLGMMIGRASGFCAISLLGFLVQHHCDGAMYTWGSLVFSALLVCILLPSDKKMKKIVAKGC